MPPRQPWERTISPENKPGIIIPCKRDNKSIDWNNLLAAA
jgi:hypothetical protein